MPHPSAMHTTFQSGGKTIRLESFEAVAHPTGGVRPAVILLHGAGGNATHWPSALRPITSHLGMALYAVHYFDRTHTARADAALLADGIHVPLWLDTLRDGLRHIAQRPHVDPQRIALVGISLGAFLSLALGTETSPDYRIRAIVDISGGLVQPYEANATAAFPPTLICHGEADTVVPPTYARSLDAVLTRLQVSHEMHLFPAESHWFSMPAQEQIFTFIAPFLIDQMKPRAS